MRLLFLNQYASGDQVPTSRLLDELAEFLRARGHEVRMVSQGEAYRSRPAAGGGRLRRELRALWVIIREGLRGSDSKPDIVLTLSSPPGLLVAGAIVARRHGAALVHWAMDLYPELAVALGEIKAGSALQRGVGVAMAWAYRQTVLTVALDEDMRAHLRTQYGIEARVMLPWPSRRSEEALASVGPAAAAAVTPWTWVYSGNLGRAHEWETLLEAQRLLETRELPIHIIFQGNGAARAAAMARAGAAGLRNCHWKDYVPEEELVPSLLASRVLVVTQRPETQGLLWPSKLAVLERLPRPILFVGRTDGDIVRRLTARGNAGIFAPGDATGVADWIQEIYGQGANRPVVLPAAMPGLAEGCALWEKWLQELSPGLR